MLAFCRVLSQPFHISCWSQASVARVQSVHHKLQRSVVVSNMWWLILLAAATTADASIIQRVAATPLARGAVLRVASDLTGGLPLEQWKTRVTRFPNETAVSSLRSVYQYQGGVK